MPDIYFEALDKLNDSAIPWDKDAYRIENGMVTCGNIPNTAPPLPGMPASGSCKTPDGIIPPMLKTIHNVFPRRTPVVDEEMGLTWGLYCFNHRGLAEIKMPDGKTYASWTNTPSSMPFADIFKTKNGKLRWHFCHRSHVALRHRRWVVGSNVPIKIKIIFVRECEMNSIRSTSESGSNSAQPNAERRSLVWKMGAALTAVFATASACAAKRETDEVKTLKEQVAQMSNQLGILEDTNAIRKLHHAYGYYLDKCIIIGEIVADYKRLMPGPEGKSQGEFPNKLLREFQMEAALYRVL